MAIRVAVTVIFRCHNTYNTTHVSVWEFMRVWNSRIFLVLLLAQYNARWLGYNLKDWASFNWSTFPAGAGKTHKIVISNNDNFNCNIARRFHTPYHFGATISLYRAAEFDGFNKHVLELLFSIDASEKIITRWKNYLILSVFNLILSIFEDENKKYTNILLWVNKKIKNDILPTKCHLTVKSKLIQSFIFPTHCFTEKNRSYDLGQRSTDIKPHNLDYKL